MGSLRVRCSKHSFYPSSRDGAGLSQAMFKPDSLLSSPGGSEAHPAVLVNNNSNKNYTESPLTWILTFINKLHKDGMWSAIEYLKLVVSICENDFFKSVNYKETVRQARYVILLYNKRVQQWQGVEHRGSD